MNEWTEERMNEQMNECTDERMKEREKEIHVVIQNQNTS